MQTVRTKNDGKLKNGFYDYIDFVIKRCCPWPACTLFKYSLLSHNLFNIPILICKLEGHQDASSEIYKAHPPRRLLQLDPGLNSITNSAMIGYFEFRPDIDFLI